MSDRAARAEPAKAFHERTGVRAAGLGAVVALLAATAMAIDLEPDLSHLDVTFLSGSAEGHYHAVAEGLVDQARRQAGKVTNVATAGSVDNVARLEAGAAEDVVRFALVQDGLPWRDGTPLELMARLPKAEAVLFLGRDADRLTRLEQLRGARVGIGPEGSGTALLAQQLLDAIDAAALGVVASSQPLDVQLRKLEAGELDLGVFVIQRDAGLVARAVRDRGLQIAGFQHVGALASRVASLRAGVLPAGHYDPVRVLPPTDKPILEVETLVVGDGSASHSETVALLSLLSAAYPELIGHNVGSANTTGIPLNADARAFFDAGGPSVLDAYAPWLVDVIPLSNLVHLVMAVSILFNLMGGGNKFALWRIDAGRVELEGELPEIFGPDVTVAEIARLVPKRADREPAKRERLQALIDRFVTLRRRCRKLSVSMLVPMGGEMSYRYQETLIGERIAALRGFLAKLDGAE